MKLIFERSRPGAACTLLPPCDVPEVAIDAPLRGSPPRLPELAEVDISRHYTALAKQAHGVNDGFYPLGSCTMKYNPRAGEEAASHSGFTGLHPLQPVETIQGALEVLCTAETLLCEITGMDRMSFQPAAGAHGEFTGLLLIKAYHAARKDAARQTILVPDAAHGTNPASASMAGYRVKSIPSNEKGCVDLEALRAAAGPDTAGLMLTNPNTVGLFDENILEITSIVHEAGGLCYYDGANLNAVMGIARPGDMGFDVVHLNLHKTFATPHGCGGPGSGPVGCREFLAPFLPGEQAVRQGEGFTLEQSTASIGRVKAFYGNFLVVVRALAYVLSLGREGIPAAAQDAVLNANYLMSRLRGRFDMAFTEGVMHEFVITLAQTKKQTGVSAMDVAKAMLDYGIHPPTMYFPLIVQEALMVEPTETESRAVLDEAARILLEILDEAETNPERLHGAPHKTPIGRPDEVAAARNPKLRYEFP